MSKIITNPLGIGDAGYFRIGNQVLHVPPDQIQCHKVINSDEVMPIRFPFGMPVKTGQSRWDVTWSWKALADFDTQDYTQWYVVQKLLAIFKAAPFVEVENGHIRQIINPSTLTTGATNDDVMAFALRQMRVDTVPDIIDALQITMTMSLFNFRPYSKNFQYDIGGGVAASSAVNSQMFDIYLNNWIQANITNPPQLTGLNVINTDWTTEVPGEVSLSCREYIACKLPWSVANPQGSGTPTTANPGASSPGAAAQGGQSSFVDNVVISPITASNPQVQWWVTAVKAGESSGSGGYTAINKATTTYSGAPSVAVGCLQWVRGSAIDAMKGSDTVLGTSYISTAVQNQYLISSKSASCGYVWNPNKIVSNPQSSDPSCSTYISWMLNPPITGGGSKLQNDMATGWAIQKLQANNGSVLSAWEAQYFGQGIVNKGQADPDQQNKYFTTLVNGWKAAASAGGQPNPNAFAAAPNTIPTPQPNPPPVGTNVVTNTSPNTTSQVTNTPTPIGQLPMTPEIQWKLTQGYTYESNTNFAAFLYKIHTIKMTSLDPVFGGTPSIMNGKIPTVIDPQHFVNPNQISIVFANNISQLPLASYEYPTYQHLGPVSTMVSIGLLSSAAIPPAQDTYPEPEHTGLSYISSMTDLLEKQFQRLRTEWRYVSSIQSMQAMTVSNQVLNLLGIRGLLTKELTTETIPDSPNLVSAQYNATQYENVFEELNSTDPFFVDNGVYGPIWDKILRDGILDNYRTDQSLLAVTNLAHLMQYPDTDPAQTLLYQWMLPNATVKQLLPTWFNKSTLTPTPAFAYTVPTPPGFAFSPSEQALMIKIFDETPPNSFFDSGSFLSGLSFNRTFPDVANILISHNPFNYSDYFMINNWVKNNPTLSDAGVWNTAAAAIEQRITKALNALNPVPESPIDTLFDAYFADAYSNNVGNLQTQLAKAATIPAIAALLQAGGSKTPGETNADHGCYRDMGISQLSFADGSDYTPAVYFHDDNAEINAHLQQQIQTIVNKVTASAKSFSTMVPIYHKDQLMQSTTGPYTSTNLSGIISTVSTSSYTMAKAFPTFKLFLMEDDSQKPFYAFDKFYSYATVLDMEVIRYRDKPDTAVIKISNLMHLLDQHLYDTTPQGSQQQRLNKEIQVQLPAGSDTLTSGGGVGYQTINVDSVDIDNRFKEIGTSAGDQKFPLHYFALQTGTKIQIRMGFSNMPDNLTPVFTGEVTEIEGDEILTITAQSYMLELITPSTDILQGDGFAVDTALSLPIQALAHAKRDVLQGNLLAIGTLGLSSIIGTFWNPVPTYSGVGSVGGITIPGIITPGGGAQDVMSAMLRVSSAKHFGRWQLDDTPDLYVKGWTWQAMAGSVLTLFNSSPLTNGSTGLESGFDRSFENILTSHVFSPDGTVATDTTGNIRGVFFERPGKFGAPEYSVPKDPNLTPWTLIQDIARRYPEFILAVKQYGFPYTADATLVFAHPLDFYASRATIPSDITLQQQATSNNQVFLNWWSGNNTTSGKSQLTTFCNTLGAPWVSTALSQYGISLGTAQDNSTLFTSSTDLLMANIINATTFFKVVLALSTSIEGGFFGINIDAFFSSTPKTAVQQNLEQIVQNYYSYYQQIAPATPGSSSTSRMKPVRRYHLVNEDNIIHDGIMLNDHFYNSVTLAGLNIKANANIPDQYIRLLNADSAIVCKDNVADKVLRQANIGSFLRDEVAKMYRGEIVLLGNPEIEPFDVLTINDPSLGVAGYLEVDSVIHSFNQEIGYITIVRPRTLVQVNDKLSMSILQGTQEMLNQVGSIISGYAPGLTAPLTPDLPIVGGAGSVGMIALDTAAVVGGLAAGPWIAAGVALGATSLIFMMGEQVQTMNPIGICPLMRFERPWVGGLEGFKINDLAQYVAEKWQLFKEDEIYPTLYSFRVAKQMKLIP